ncbi:anti-sigma factor domain-containing protein [Donghicola sp. XS_ASV15]|uniref:anti-sigma factor n=1 Tax=Donghicola sp. XS_ASV15 TaxID=3241295 RepID=UPI0035124A21
MTDRPLDILIDECVLGLAEDDDIARLEAMAASDPVIAARLDFARQKFAPLDQTADDMALPDGFWDRVDAQLNGQSDVDTPDATAGTDVIDLRAVRAQAARWRVSALGGIAAALVMAVVLAWSFVLPQEQAVVAVLLNDRGEAIALVEGMPDNTTRVTLLETQNVPQDQVMQVWTKPEDDGPPVSLGLLDTGRSRTLTIDGLPSPNAQQLYEITSEPAGGSPTNLPTGPILGKGFAKEPLI